MYHINSVLLRQKMIACGYNSIVSLAKATNLSRDTISDVISSKTKPQAGVMYAIAKALQLSSEEAGQIFFAHSVA